MSATLILQFEGWIIIRQPTDPDPTDESRGVSGYTFAFAGEPDLNRVLYLQPSKDFPLRSYTPDIGVTVRQALRLEGNTRTDIPELVGAKVDLLDEPKLENRNWTLTVAGFEPIVPFNLHIEGGGIAISRSAPLDPTAPKKPIWKMTPGQLQAHSANGVIYEPATIGNATGIWDSLALAEERLANLERDLTELQQKPRKSPKDKVAIAALEGRISELKIGIAQPQDRRIVARYFVERFTFTMEGGAQLKPGGKKIGGGTLDKKSPWTIGFWIGAWEPDTLSCYLKGALEIPYK